MSKKHPEIFGDVDRPGAVASYDPNKINEVELPFVRQGTHEYEVRYAYYTGEGGSRIPGDHGIRREATIKVEAWSAADAVVQTAIQVDNIYASSRCKILSVKPTGK